MFSAAGRSPIFRPCPLLKTPFFLSGHVQIIMSLFKEVVVVLRLNVPVNNFSVMSGRSHRFLGN